MTDAVTPILPWLDSMVAKQPYLNAEKDLELRVELEDDSSVDTVHVIAKEPFIGDLLLAKLSDGGEVLLRVVRSVKTESLLAHPMTREMAVRTLRTKGVEKVRESQTTLVELGGLVEMMGGDDE